MLRYDAFSSRSGHRGISAKYVFHSSSLREKYSRAESASSQAWLPAGCSVEPTRKVSISDCQDEGFSFQRV